GHQVRTLRLPVGSHADQVVVDERRGRAYVLLAPSTGRTLTVPVLDATSGRNAHTGRVVRTIVVVGVPTNLVVSQRLGRVFVSTTGPSGLRVTTGREGNGSVHVLDGRSGTIVRTWPVGRLPRTNLAGGTAPQPHGHG